MWPSFLSVTRVCASIRQVETTKRQWRSSSPREIYCIIHSRFVVPAKVWRRDEVWKWIFAPDAAWWATAAKNVNKKITQDKMQASSQRRGMRDLAYSWLYLCKRGDSSCMQPSADKGWCLRGEKPSIFWRGTRILNSNFDSSTPIHERMHIKSYFYYYNSSSINLSVHSDGSKLSPVSANLKILVSKYSSMHLRAISLIRWTSFLL